MPIMAAENQALAGAWGGGGMPFASGVGYSLSGMTGVGLGGFGGAQVWSAAGSPQFNQMRATGYPAFLTSEQMARLERIRQARLLLTGQHRQYFLEECRTSFDFPQAISNGVTRQMYCPFNVLGLASIKGADLLFGQEPLLDCSDDQQWDAIHAFARRSKLHIRLIDGAIMGSAEGECYFEVMVHTDGKVYTRRVMSESIFPVGELGPDGQYGSYVRYLVKNVGTRDVAIWILLETTIEPGMIRRACWQLDDKQQKCKALAIEAWDPALAGQEQTPTGIAQNTIIWVPNLLEEAVSDYDGGAIALQDAVNAKESQVSRILQQHADPAMAVPESKADDQGNVRANYKTWFFRNKDEIPAYIPWPADLTAALEDRKQALNKLLIKLEMSPILLGLKEGAAPQTYKSMRLEANNSLSKAQRKALSWTAAVQSILDVAMALENTMPGISYATDPVGVTLRDGIPIDETEQASNIQILMSAGAMSRRRAVRLQLGDEEATETELSQIAQDAASQTPSVLFNEGHETPAASDAPSEPEMTTAGEGA